MTIEEIERKGQQEEKKESICQYPGGEAAKSRPDESCGDDNADIQDDPAPCEGMEILVPEQASGHGEQQIDNEIEEPLQEAGLFHEVDKEGDGTADQKVGDETFVFPP